MEKPHSAQFLTDVRELYWNDDWLALLSQRLRLSRVTKAVDVGSGLGHWTRRVKRCLVPQATVTGVEREAKWVAEAERADGVDYVVGTAESLPFPDASVDLVTCQTLLIHVEDPKRVLREMHRVLKPGGTLLCAEPSNAAGHVLNFVDRELDHIDEILAATRLELFMERGKAKLGQGFNSLGENLVGLLDDALWTDLRAWASDRAYVGRAPYPDDAAALLAQERKWHDDGDFLLPKDETRRFYEAGGGAPSEFDALWAAAGQLQKRRFAAVDAGTYASALGGILYVIAATKR